MAAAKITQDEFIGIWESYGPQEIVRRGISNLRNAQTRRRNIEAKIGRTLISPAQQARNITAERSGARLSIGIENGIVLIGSDAHYWPGIITTAHRGFVKFCKDMKPVAIVKNGDVMDFPSISRHAPIGWESRPQVIHEIEAAQERLHEIVKAAPKARRIWPAGNHDLRFETRLATVAPEYARVNGIHLTDHFPEWEPCWSCFINDDVVVKHRFKSGIHAPHNNTMWAGRTIVTGHLHSLKVMPISDYNGTRWGVDCGTMAEPEGPQFVDYTEDGPKNWRSGFIVLTFHRGRLLWPEIASVAGEGLIDFRGKLIDV